MTRDPKIIILACLVLGLGFFSGASAQDRAGGLAYDAQTRSAAPIPPAERDLQTAVAESWFNVSDEGPILEGAIFDRSGNLIFCDVSGRRVLRLTPDKRLSTIATLDALSPGGLAFHPDGRLFIAALDIPNGRGAIYAVHPDGSGLRSIVPPSKGYMPNDLVFDAEGGFYFTDFKGNATEPTGGVYHVAPDLDTIKPVLPYLAKANGLALSPDGKTLWVTEFARNLLHRIELADATTIAPLGSAIAYHFTGPAPDSMRADADGNVYVAIYGQGRLLVFNPNGIPIGQVLLPGRDGGHNLASTSLAIDPDRNVLYAVTSDVEKGQGATVFRTEVFSRRRDCDDSPEQPVEEPHQGRGRRCHHAERIAMNPYDEAVWSPERPTVEDPSPDISGSWPRRIVALVLLVFGLALSVGGALLVASGGSLYYLIAGLSLILSGILLWRGDARGAWIYGATLVWTVAWSLWEVGFSGWQLAPRLIAFFVVAGFLLLPSIKRLARPWRVRGDAALAAGLVTAAVVGGVAHGFGEDAEIPSMRRGVQAQAPGPLSQPLAKIDRDDWQSYGNDQGGTRFSPLDQINASNVSGLTKVWEAEMTATVPGEMNALQVTPLMVGGTLYACDGNNGVHAFDAETGQVRWRRNVSDGQKPSGKPCRGVAYYKVPDARLGALCAERIFAPSHNPTLAAIDARTGELCPGFGTKGLVDLQQGIAPYPQGLFYVSSAPQVIRGKVVVGGGIPDGQYWGGPSGVIRAFDAVTGDLTWAFDAGAPERIGAPVAGQVYTPSMPNSWAPISADEQLGLVYLPMGGATPDAYGGLRRPFDDDIGSAVVALDAETGRMRWRFQTTHHDIWDYDVASQPTLVNLPTPQGMRPVLIQPTKRGEVFVLDRETGAPIKTVREVLAPQGGVAKGERLSPTQPESSDLPAFREPDLREKDMWGMTPLDQLYCRLQFKRSRYEGMFTPVTLNQTIVIAPGSMGGINWNGISLDADRGIMIVNWTQVPDRLELITREESTRRNFQIAPGLDAGGQTDQPMLNTPYGAYRTQFLSPLGSPCTAPPWGAIAGVDLVSGKLLWSKPFGTGRDIGPLKLGVKTMLPITIGTPTAGGAVTTRGGLVFIGGAAEHTFRALETATGRELWSSRLATSANATPMTYRSPVSGRQFVVVAEGGRPAYGTKPGTKLVAFALPAVKQ